MPFSTILIQLNLTATNWSENCALSIDCHFSSSICSRSCFRFTVDFHLHRCWNTTWPGMRMFLWQGIKNRLEKKDHRCKSVNKSCWNEEEKKSNEGEMLTWQHVLETDQWKVFCFFQYYYYYFPTGFLVLNSIYEQWLALIWGILIIAKTRSVKPWTHGNCTMKMSNDETRSKPNKKNIAKHPENKKNHLSPQGNKRQSRLCYFVVVYISVWILCHSVISRQFIDILTFKVLMGNNHYACLIAKWA